MRELLVHQKREHTTPAALAESVDLNAPREDEDPPSSPELQAALSEWIEHYYDSWLDHPLPALGNMTPREAAGTRVGREQLHVLLKSMENDAARGEGMGAPDMARLRSELGLRR